MISAGTKSIIDSINQLNIAQFYLLKEKMISDVELNSTVQNIVAVLNLNIPLNLQKIHEKIKNTAYNPDNFTGVILKIPEKPIVFYFLQAK